jgi:hypothetical protein
MPIIYSLFRRFLFAAIVIPLAAAGVRKVSDVVEARRGPSRATRLMRKGADTVQSTFGRQNKRRRFF